MRGGEAAQLRGILEEVADWQRLIFVRGRWGSLSPELVARIRVAFEEGSLIIRKRLDDPESRKFWESVEEAWDAEIRRRIKEIDAGVVELVPWEEVKRRIEKDARER